MANEKFTQLPTVVSATLADIYAMVQSGVSSQVTGQQMFNLFLSNTVLNYAGDPNGNVAGSTYQFCWDTVGTVMYVCTTSGNAATAVWSLAGATSFPVSVVHGGTGLSSTTINQILYSSAANTIAGLATVNNASLTTNASGVPTWLALTDGQVIIGSSTGAPAAAQLVAGTGISIVNAANSITINGTGSGFSWTEVTGTSQAMVADNGYIANNAGLVTLTLPATCGLGQSLSVVGLGAGGWSIAQNAGQTIHFNSNDTTTGAGGSLSSTNRYNSIELMCVVANTDFVVVDSSGSFTIV